MATAGIGGATGGTASGGNSAGGTATGGSSGSGGGSGDKSATAPSKGCGSNGGVTSITTGGSSVMGGLPTSVKTTIMSGGMKREFIIDIPADYNPMHPYRLVFSWHQAYGSATGNANGQHPANDGDNFDAQNYAFFGLHREATAAKEPVIFVAPQGIGDFPWDFTRGVALFDDLLTLVDENLCIDDNRVFSTGFGYGAMMSYALSITRQKKLRAVVAMAPANYHLPGEPMDSNAAPVAFMGTTGMSDDRCPWVNSDSAKEGGKYCALAHAEDNGCTIPGSIPTTTVGSKKYLCYDFEGCKAGYPVKVCTFDGPHTPSSVDDGSTTKDDGLKAFIPPLAWKFISQF
jgi:poly(3-hydroxybutyrate) depolymerase